MIWKAGKKGYLHEYSLISSIRILRAVAGGKVCCAGTYYLSASAVVGYEGCCCWLILFVFLVAVIVIFVLCIISVVGHGNTMYSYLKTI